MLFFGCDIMLIGVFTDSLQFFVLASAHLMVFGLSLGVCCLLSVVTLIYTLCIVSYIVG